MAPKELSEWVREREKCHTADLSTTTRYCLWSRLDVWEPKFICFPPLFDINERATASSLECFLTSGRNVRNFGTAQLSQIEVHTSQQVSQLEYDNSTAAASLGPDWERSHMALRPTPCVFLRHFRGDSCSQFLGFSRCLFRIYIYIFPASSKLSQLTIKIPARYLSQIHMTFRWIIGSRQKSQQMPKKKSCLNISIQRVGQQRGEKKPKPIFRG